MTYLMAPFCLRGFLLLQRLLLAVQLQLELSNFVHDVEGARGKTSAKELLWDCSEWPSLQPGGREGDASRPALMEAEARLGALAWTLD